MVAGEVLEVLVLAARAAAAGEDPAVDCLVVDNRSETCWEESLRALDRLDLADHAVVRLVDPEVVRSVDPAVEAPAVGREAVGAAPADTREDPLVPLTDRGVPIT